MLTDNEKERVQQILQSVIDGDWIRFRSLSDVAFLNESTMLVKFQETHGTFEMPKTIPTKKSIVEKTRGGQKFANIAIENSVEDKQKNGERIIQLFLFFDKRNDQHTCRIDLITVTSV